MTDFSEWFKCKNRNSLKEAIGKIFNCLKMSLKCSDREIR